MPPVNKTVRYKNLLHPIKTIYKYPFDVQDEFELLLPGDSTILDVQVQNDRPCLWVLVDPSTLAEPVRFRLFGTGHPIPKDVPLEYVGTFQLWQGKFIGHLFRVKEE